MISVAEAKKIILENTDALSPVKCLLQEAAGKILAEDIFSAVDIPAFPQSAMDGYAFSFNDWKQQQELIINGEMAAGDYSSETLQPGTAIRIFTGAPVPNGADTVVMQEKVIVKDGKLMIEDDILEQGRNVRLKGSEIKTGEPALEKESILSPAAIGFLAGIGVTEVMTIPNPVISIIITGKELQQPGKTLAPGQVYESNSFSLTAVLKQLHFSNIKIYSADDDLEILTGMLKEALEKSDLVLLTGGISVGDYDFVLKATENCGVTKLFHRIKQRPGKPLFFGKKANKLVFGLPGNPSSVLTCFYEYVLTVLSLMTKRKISLSSAPAPLASSFSKKILLTQFLKGHYNGENVTILDAQESYRMSSFAKANCFVVLEEPMKEYAEGGAVEIHLLPA
ncbi:MAG: molybdopterin molybdotransferase MoeA [Sphingobacteriales bacterium]|nr:molybdopterin molybdotransferase MoeA [Sphingobacteriales bacterium]MBI3717678.1 molybdopterin molybdotransferase MoeA [Sphingobacteriales bacterium]